MFNSIFIYFALLGIGGVLSYKGIIHDKLLKRAGYMQMVFLYILIFIMGIRLGMNKDVIESLGTIGFKSGIFAVMTAVGGISGVFIIDRTIIKSGNSRKKESMKGGTDNDN
jgi:uncharacterized membrane protein YbjE (DUF340 family)